MYKKIHQKVNKKNRAPEVIQIHSILLRQKKIFFLLFHFTSISFRLNIFEFIFYYFTLFSAINPSFSLILQSKRLHSYIFHILYYLVVLLSHLNSEINPNMWNKVCLLDLSSFFTKKNLKLSDYKEPTSILWHIEGEEQFLQQLFSFFSIFHTLSISPLHRETFSPN